MQYKAILFDLDGTLLDSIPIILKTANDVCRAMGIPYNESVLRNMIGTPLKEQAPVCAGERAEEWVTLYRQVYRKYQDQSPLLFPGTIQMLDALDTLGYITGLVTSKAANGTCRILEQMNLADRFSVIVTADDVTNAKPHPEPILKALEMLCVSPSEAVYGGDTLHDAEAAQKAGVTMLGVSWGAKSRAELEPVCPDGVFDDWQELVDWLNR